MKFKQYIPILVAIIGIVLLSSCSHYSGSISSNYSGVIPTNMKSFTGQSSANYVLGIGGNHHQGLIQEAKENLYYKIRKFEAPKLINYTVDIKRTNYFFYYKVTAYVSAEMVNYGSADETVKEEVEKDQQNKLFGFYVGEKVKYKVLGKEKFGKIIKLKKKNALVQSQDLLKREWVSLRSLRKIESKPQKGEKLTF